MSSSQDPIGGEQGTTAPSVSLSHVEDKTDAPRELSLAREMSVINESIGLVRVGGDDRPEEGESVQEAGSLPDGPHYFPVDGTNLGRGQGNC